MIASIFSQPRSRQAFKFQFFATIRVVALEINELAVAHAMLVVCAQHFVRVIFGLVVFVFQMIQIKKDTS